MRMKIAPICLMIAVSFALACQADIRPDSLTGITKPTKAVEKRGRALLKEAANTHGLNAFDQVNTYEMEIKDQWKGVMGSLGNPWPDKYVHAKLAFRARSFDARATFLHKAQKGRVWGMQSWKTYTIEPGKTKPVFEDNDDAKFILPAIQYLTEFIFRDHSDKIVAYAGKETIRGVAYERVFITWSSLEPSSKHDQYLVYIHPKTRQVAKISYTVREFMDMATGSIHFEDVRSVSGILFPYKQSVTAKATDDPNDYMHRITILRVTLNSPAESTLLINERLRKVGDKKP